MAEATGTSGTGGTTIPPTTDPSAGGGTRIPPPDSGGTVSLPPPSTGSSGNDCVKPSHILLAIGILGALLLGANYMMSNSTKSGIEKGFAGQSEVMGGMAKDIKELVQIAKTSKEASPTTPGATRPPTDSGGKARFEFNASVEGEWPAQVRRPADRVGVPPASMPATMPHCPDGSDPNDPLIIRRASGKGATVTISGNRRVVIPGNPQDKIYIE